jgi:hypothetical protein
MLMKKTTPQHGYLFPFSCSNSKDELEHDWITAAAYKDPTTQIKRRKVIFAEHAD